MKPKNEQTNSNVFEASNNTFPEKMSLFELLADDGQSLAKFFLDFG